MKILILCMKSEVHLQFCVEDIDRTVGEDYCLLALSLAQVVHERIQLTVPHAVYTKLRFETGPFHISVSREMASIQHFL
jgi:hypothetical protein